VCPPMDQDRVVAPDLARVAELIAAGKLANVLH